MLTRRITGAHRCSTGHWNTVMTTQWEGAGCSASHRAWARERWYDEGRLPRGRSDPRGDACCCLASPRLARAAESVGIIV